VIDFRLEQPGDSAAVRSIHEAAFGRRDEAVLVEQLCADGDAMLSLVAVDSDDDTVVGHLIFSDLPIKTISGLVRAAALAPVAVLPDRQGVGIGGGLIMRGLRDIAALGVEAVIVLGEPAYYQRFGFSHDLVRDLETSLQSEALMGMALKDGVLDGVEGRPLYAPAFGLDV